MPNCINYNCTELGTHTQNNCNATKLGGIPAIIILGCDHTITDPSDGTAINAEIAAGRAWLVERIKVGVNAASAVTEESSVSGVFETLLTYDREATLVDNQVNDTNRQFYDSLFNGQEFGGIITYEKYASQVSWYDAAIVFQGSRPVPNENNASSKFEGVFKWRSMEDGSIYTVPTGVFSI